MSNFQTPKCDFTDHFRSQNAQICDVLVWGLGGMGSAAAWQLAERGAQVIGIDQFGPAHSKGSSHGQSRIIRKAYFEHPDYVPLLNVAYDLWSDIENRTGQSLFERVGLFIAGQPSSPAVAGTIQAAREHALPLVEFSPADARSEFPGFRFPDHFHVVYEEQAGYLNVERCVLAQLELARRSGADLHFDEQLLSYSVENGGIRIRTSTTEYLANKLILAAGAWSTRFVPVLRVLRKPLFWYRSTPQQLSAKRPGTFFFDTDFGQYYGFPSLDGVTFKVAEHTGGDLVIDPGQVDRSMHDVDRNSLARFLQNHIPGCEAEPVEHCVCMYTVSPDHHFVIDRHPESSRVIVAAGFSGHGFKFTPVVGKILADLALTDRTDLSIDFLRWNRFEAN